MIERIVPPQIILLHLDLFLFHVKPKRFWKNYQKGMEKLLILQKVRLGMDSIKPEKGLGLKLSDFMI